MKAKTQNYGAGEERSKIRRFVVAHANKYRNNPDVWGCCGVIIEYIDGRTKRDNARKGGLGK